MGTLNPSKTLFSKAGFTLLELLIVLVIMALVSGLIAVKAFPDDTRSLRTDAERLAQLLSIAQEEAGLRSAHLVWMPIEGGYQFFEQTEDGLQNITQEDFLKPRRWQLTGTLCDIVIDGRPRLRLDILPQTGAQMVQIKLNAAGRTIELRQGLGGRYTVQ